MRACLLAIALALSSQAQSIVLHAARLLDIESGRIIAPGEVLVQGDRIVRSRSKCCPSLWRSDPRLG